MATSNSRDGVQSRDQFQEDYSKYLQLVNNCDDSDPLLSETPLGQCLEQIPLAQLPLADLIKLSQALNVEQLIPSLNGPPRDYRGLSELMGFSSVELEATFRRSHNPAKSLIEAYVQRQRFSRPQPSDRPTSKATLNELLKFLESLERFDIIDDFLPDLIKLVQQREQNKLVPYGGDRVGPVLKLNGSSSSSPLVQYDAFVCFAPEDEGHARELIYLLERHNKRIFTMDHLLPGRLEFDALVQIIASDCRKVVIVLTPNFFKSRDCDFQTKFATELDIKSGWSAKIIPVKCEHVDDSQLPPLIRVLSKIDMTSGAYSREWQLKRLLHSLADHDAPDQRPHFGPYSRPYHHHHHQFPAGDERHRDAHSNLADSPQPIIDLAYSQSSDSALDLGTQLSIVTSNNDQPHDHLSTTSRISSPSPSSFYVNGRRAPQTASSSSCTSSAIEPWYKKANWYQKIKRSLRDPTSSKSSCGSNSPSTSNSRARLVPHESGDEKS